MEDGKMKGKKAPKLKNILVYLAAFFSFSSLAFLFLPILQIRTGFGEVIDVNSTIIMFGGKINISLPSGDYHLSFAANIFFFIILQIVLLSTLSLLTSVNSKRNQIISFFLLTASIVFYSLIPVWISTVNKAYSAGEFEMLAGFFLTISVSSLALALDLVSFFLREKDVKNR